MKIGKGYRGPKLGTKLVLFGLALLVIPWISYRQLYEMENLLLQGQTQTQLLTAEGISTLFNGREDLFNDLPLELENFESLFAHPLDATIRLDGNPKDWGDNLMKEYLSFGMNGFSDGDFELLLGERSNLLYVHLRILDDKIVYRDRTLLKLDNSDQIRLDFQKPNGTPGRVTLAFEKEGSLTGFEMDEQWKYASSGQAISDIQGKLIVQSGELWLEFRFPLNLLGSRKHFGITFTDVDDDNSRNIVRQTRTTPKPGKQSFNLVVLRTPEVRNIVQGLGYSGAKILVIDDRKRIRAEVGKVQIEDRLDSNASKSLKNQLSEIFEVIRPMVHLVATGETYDPANKTSNEQQAFNEALSASLSGQPMAIRSSTLDDQEIIVVAHPIISSEEVIGSVIVEQNIKDILTFQRKAFEEVILLSALSLLVIFIALIAFAGRLAWRIRTLRREASSAIDSYGRLKDIELKSEVQSGDEIGDLARSIANMLSKLRQHNTFLASMPRTLRHEINNPLNTLSTSLQNLALNHEEVSNSKYLESAKRGVNRIGSIVQNLADAANLEEALQSEDFELIDLGSFLESYINNYSLVHPKESITYTGCGERAFAMASDFRVEQMMDKIMDNAIDFHRKDSAIKVQLDKVDQHLRITVANRGSILPPSIEDSLFESMVSHRDQHNRLHFGLGLYVVRIIAEHHGGYVRAANLIDNSGVAVVIQLPLAQKLKTPEKYEPTLETRKKIAG